MKNNGRVTLREKFKNLSLEDEYRIRFLEGLPTRRIEKKILKHLRGKAKHSVRTAKRGHNRHV